MIAVLLAAGRGERMGGVAKALLAIEGESFLARIGRTLAGAGVHEIVVVVGPPHAGEVADRAAELGMAVAHNPAPERGMASSVATGFAALAARTDQSALLWPVDVARVAPATVSQVVAGAGAELIVVPTWQGRGGHPTAFGRSLWPELVACAALPAGALSVVHRDPGRVRRIAVDDPFILADVDRPADLEPAR